MVKCVVRGFDGAWNKSRFATFFELRYNKLSFVVLGFCFYIICASFILSSFDTLIKIEMVWNGTGNIEYSHQRTSIYFFSSSPSYWFPPWSLKCCLGWVEGNSCKNSYMISSSHPLLSTITSHRTVPEFLKKHKITDQKKGLVKLTHQEKRERKKISRHLCLINIKWKITKLKWRKKIKFVSIMHVAETCTQVLVRRFFSFSSR